MAKRFRSTYRPLIALKPFCNPLRLLSHPLLTYRPSHLSLNYLLTPLAHHHHMPLSGLAPRQASLPPHPLHQLPLNLRLIFLLTLSPWNSSQRARGSTRNTRKIIPSASSFLMRAGTVVVYARQHDHPPSARGIAHYAILMYVTHACSGQAESALRAVKAV